MYRSNTSFEEAFSQLVTGTGTTTALRMENHFPRGHQQMMVKLEEPVGFQKQFVMLNYGTKKMRKLVRVLGEDVLMIPEECITMHGFQEKVLHMEHDWVKSAEWPFVALSTTSTTAVVPFDESCQEGIMPSIIMVIPTGFITASIRLALDVELGSHHKQGGSFYWRQYEDSEHFKLGKLRTVRLINMISLMLIHNSPTIFTLA